MIEKLHVFKRANLFHRSPIRASNCTGGVRRTRYMPHQRQQTHWKTNRKIKTDTYRVRRKGSELGVMGAYVTG